MTVRFFKQFLEVDVRKLFKQFLEADVGGSLNSFRKFWGGAQRKLHQGCFISFFSES